MNTYRNSLLQRCAPEILSRLALRQVDLPARREIEFPGQRIESVLFLESGVASMTATFQDGFEVEVALVGWNAVLCASGLVGTRRSLNRVYMQIAGSGFRCDLAVAAREFRRGDAFHDLVTASQQAQFVQTAQTAACNARHTVEQRLSRWLLLCVDYTGSHNLPLKHEFLAQILGVTRPSISIAAGALQDRGLIQYSRGRLKVLDRSLLQLLSCECYKVVREHLSSQTDVGKAALCATARLHAHN